MTETKMWNFGDIHARMEGADTVFAHITSEARAEDVRGVARLFSELAAKGPFYLVCDITDLKLSPEARKVSSEAYRLEWFAGTVIIGASMLLRTVVKSIQLALLAASFFGHAVDRPVCFAKNETEARELIAAIKSKVAA